MEEKIEAICEQVGISQQRKGVLLPSFIISTRPLYGAITYKIASLFLSFELFNQLINYCIAETLNFQKHPSKYDFNKIFLKILQIMCAS